MTYRELFDAAVRMVAENAEEGDVTDYEDRSSYLLATVSNQCAALDRAYRLANGAIDTALIKVGVCVMLDETFPLSDAFAPAVTYYLAAMLVLDENEEMSDTLFSRYADAIAQLRSQMPAVTEKIVNRYDGTL